MNVIVKHVVEIAGGLVVGNLMYKGAEKVIKIAGNKVKNLKKKGA